jgi:hypothetical protein
MATFKVGQRVKVVSVMSSWRDRYGYLIGKVGTVTALGVNVWHCCALIDGCPSHDPKLGWGFMRGELTPLTDPKAVELIAAFNKQMGAPVGPQIPVKERSHA